MLDRIESFIHMTYFVIFMYFLIYFSNDTPLNSKSYLNELTPFRVSGEFILCTLISSMLILFFFPYGSILKSDDLKSNIKYGEMLQASFACLVLSIFGIIFLAGGKPYNVCYSIGLIIIAIYFPTSIWILFPKKDKKEG